MVQCPPPMVKVFKQKVPKVQRGFSAYISLDAWGASSSSGVRTKEVQCNVEVIV